jgi:T6SS immunity protein Tdi1, C-terminal
MSDLPRTNEGRADLEQLGALWVKRYLGAGDGSQRGLVDSGEKLAHRMRRAAMDLGMSRATEFDPWIWRLDLMAAKVALLALGPAGERLRFFENPWGYHQYHGSKHVGQVRDYHRFRIEYIAGEGLVELVRGAWGWALPEPVGIVTMSLFGNLLVECEGGTIWRICPEDLEAEHVTRLVEGLEPRFRDEAFRTDWEAQPWVKAAREALGPLGAGQCYGFKRWPVLGAEYAVENMVIKSTREWIELSGEAAQKVG